MLQAQILLHEMAKAAKVGTDWRRRRCAVHAGCHISNCCQTTTLPRCV